MSAAPSIEGVCGVMVVCLCVCGGVGVGLDRISGRVFNLICWRRARRVKIMLEEQIRRGLEKCVGEHM